MGSWHFALPRQRLDPCEGWKCSHLYQHQTWARPNVGGFWFFLKCWTHLQPFFISINSQTESGSDWTMCEEKSAHLSQNNSSLNGLGGGITFPDTLETPLPSHKSLSDSSLCSFPPHSFGDNLIRLSLLLLPNSWWMFGPPKLLKKMMVYIELFHRFSSLCPALPCVLR